MTMPLHPDWNSIHTPASLRVAMWLSLKDLFIECCIPVSSSSSVSTWQLSARISSVAVLQTKHRSFAASKNQTNSLWTVLGTHWFCRVFAPRLLLLAHPSRKTIPNVQSHGTGIAPCPVLLVFATLAIQVGTFPPSVTNSSSTSVRCS